MTEVTVQGNITLLKNNAIDATGVAIPPVDLEYGQIAVNYNAKDPCIFIKVLGDNNTTSIQKFVGEEVIAKTLSDILGESAADLDTLRELIKQFEGSSNDVLTLVKNIQTEVGNKANTSDLNAHKNSTSNPHSVTKAQVGLANVRNVAQLGQTETAADSSKLGGKAAADYWHKANSNLNTVDWNARNLTAVSGTIAAASSQLLVLNRTDSDSNNTIKFQGKSITKYLGFSNGILRIGDSSDLSASGNVTVWHSGNSNLGTIDWACKNLNASGAITTTGNITANYITAKGGSFNIDSPDTTAVWYRGLIFRNKDNSSVFGSVGMFGSGDVAARISLGFGSSTWTDTGVHITKDNNVGVGITAPEAKFDVSGSAIIRGSLSVGGVNPTHKFESATSGANVYAGYFYHGASANGFGLYVRAGNNADDRIATFQNRGGGNSVLFYGNNNCQFTGNVGFSTGSPIDKIHIVGGGVTLSNGQSFRIQDSGGVAKRVASLDSNNNIFIGAIDSTTANVYVRHNGINAIQITGANVANTICLNSGKVGIGTGAPLRTLHTVGDVRMATGTHTAIPALGAALGNRSFSITSDAASTPYGLYVGVLGNGSTWIQAGRTDSETAYNIIMQSKGGNVGINVGIPSEKLDVSGNIKGSNNLILTATSGNKKIIFGNQDSSGANKPSIIMAANGSTSIGTGTSWSDSSGGTFTGNFNFNSDGRFGIGTATPTEKLEVSSGNISITGGATGTESAPQWKGFKLKSYSGNDLFKLMIGDCSSSLHTGFFIIDQRKNDSTGTFVRRFQITPYGDTVIDSPLLRARGNGMIDGNLVVKGETGTYTMDGVETYAISGVSRLSDLEDVDISGAEEGFVLYKSTDKTPNGDFIWKAKTAEKYWSDIHDKPTEFTPCNHNHIGSTYVATPSDRRLKTDIEVLSNPLNTILSINPVSYNWTSDAMERYGFSNHSSIGVIAQELEDIIPTAITQLDEQYKAVDYIQIIPYLVGAVKQLNSELADKNIAISNARGDFKKMYGEMVKLRNEVSSLKLELDELKSLYKQTLD